MVRYLAYTGGCYFNNYNYSLQGKDLAKEKMKNPELKSYLPVKHCPLKIKVKVSGPFSSLLFSITLEVWTTGKGKEQENSYMLGGGNRAVFAYDILSKKNILRNSLTCIRANKCCQQGWYKKSNMKP